MLRNNWVIIDKDPIRGVTGCFRYTIMPVDAESGSCLDEDDEAYSECIDSKRNLDIGTYTDDELTPLQELYNSRKANTDIATLEYTQINIGTMDAVRVAVFGRRFGELYFLMDPEHMPLKMQRGNHIMIERTYDASNIREIPEPYAEDDEDDEDEEDEDIKKRPPVVGVPIFHPLYNITTRQKSRYFTSMGEMPEDWDNVVVLDKSPTERTNYNIHKYLLVYSRKFKRHISFLVEEYTPEFRSKAGDKILLEKYWNKNTGRHEYRILSNLTIDSMRNKFLLNTK